MKRFIYVILLILPLLLSCDKESGRESADYYVKYEYSLSFNNVMGSASYPNKTITISTDKGTNEVSTTSNTYTETIGPVKKGFTANITVKYNSSSSGGTTHLKIYVCRGSEPFALKATNETYSSTASYTIDF